MTPGTKRIAIIGAGPVGLAAAAHALERGHEPIVLEAGPEVGHAVRQWGHVRMFSPWEYNVDQSAARLLANAGWNAPPPSDYPTGAELAEAYLEPLAARTPLASRIHTKARVTAVSRKGASTRSRARVARRRPLSSATRMARDHAASKPMPLSTYRERGDLPIPQAPTASPLSASPSAHRASPTPCRTCWAASARATRENASQSLAQATPRSAP